MGQYYAAVNLDKKQYLYPHDCGDGAKLMEFVCSSIGMMSALAILLADGNGRGGGDLRATDPQGLIGSWAGDRIVIAGDYADDGKFLDGFQGAKKHTLYGYASDHFKNISIPVMRVLAEDVWVREELKRRSDGYMGSKLWSNLGAPK
jgi:hypothetical protein